MLRTLRSQLSPLRKHLPKIQLSNTTVMLVSVLSTSLLSSGLVTSYRHSASLQRLAVRARALSMAENDQGAAYSVQKSEAEWREGLSNEEYRVLRQKGTERPGSGEYNKFAPKDGHFVCAGCEQSLYSAAAKFDSGCGWPAFDKIVEGGVVTMTDRSMGMSRVEIMCGGCGGHLGHVFEGERMTDTNERHHGQSALLGSAPAGSCASLRRTWRLRAARHVQGSPRPLGAQLLPRVLERAASKVAGSLPFDL